MSFKAQVLEFINSFIEKLKIFNNLDNDWYDADLSYQ